MGNYGLIYASYVAGFAVAFALIGIGIYLLATGGDSGFLIFLLGSGGVFAILLNLYLGGFRGHARDGLCTALQALGIQAQMAPRGRAEEKIYPRDRRSLGSLGVIDIAEGPIRWVNVTRGTLDTENETDTSFYLEYGVPDPNVRSGFPEVRLEAISVHEPVPDSRWWFLKFPVLGPVIGVRWEGKDFGLGIAEHLSQNVLVPTAFSEGSFEIRAYPDRGCWTLTVNEVLAPSKQEWDCYQSIASHLLGTTLPANT